MGPNGRGARDVSVATRWHDAGRTWKGATTERRGLDGRNVTHNEATGDEKERSKQKGTGKTRSLFVSVWCARPWILCQFVVDVCVRYCSLYYSFRGETRCKDGHEVEEVSQLLHSFVFVRLFSKLFLSFPNYIKLFFRYSFLNDTADEFANSRPTHSMSKTQSYYYDFVNDQCTFDSQDIDAGESSHSRDDIK